MITELFGLPCSGKTTYCLEKIDKSKYEILFVEEYNFGTRNKFVCYLVRFFFVMFAFTTTNVYYPLIKYLLADDRLKLRYHKIPYLIYLIGVYKFSKIFKKKILLDQGLIQGLISCIDKHNIDTSHFSNIISTLFCKILSNIKLDINIIFIDASFETIKKRIGVRKKKSSISKYFNQSDFESTVISMIEESRLIFNQLRNNDINIKKVPFHN